MSLRLEFERNGFACPPAVLEAGELEPLRDEADRLLARAPERGGARHGLRDSELFADLGRSPRMARFAAAILGPTARPVKLTVFDKTAEANWKVPWHQDLTIAVREQHDLPGFGPWSTKGGLPHVRPPVAVLESIVALRLHLDDASEGNGALRVLPGTHLLGRLADHEVERIATGRAPLACPVPAGGVMLMSPLLLHASSAVVSPSRRRVLHFEYVAAELPSPLLWT